jgi:hypothetical protein
MGLRIKEVRKILPEEWDEAWRNCDYASYFHSREWAEIWQTVSQGKMQPAAKLILFSDGQKAVIPLSRHKKECISSPEGTYGGWISKDSLSLEHAQLLTDYMLNKCGDLLWRINPYDQNVLNTGIKPTDRETYRLDLSAGSGLIIKKFANSNVRAIKKAQEYGVTIRVASTVQDWQEYFKAYEESIDRWEKIDAEDRHSWEVFEHIYSRRSPFIRLWLASYKDKIISGALCLYAKNNVIYWHGAGLKDYFIYRPVNLLHYEIIKDACHNGYAWYDFNPSHGLKGVIAFKKTFGTVSTSCPLIQVRTRMGGLFRKVVYL